MQLALGIGYPLGKDTKRTPAARGSETIQLKTNLRSRRATDSSSLSSLEEFVAYPLVIALRLGEAVISYGECLANVGPGDSAMTLRCLFAKGTCLFQVRQKQIFGIVVTTVGCLRSLSCVTPCSRVTWCTSLVPTCVQGFGLFDG